MAKDKNPFLEDKEYPEEGKIGFDSAPPIKKGEKVEHFQEHLPGKPLRTATKIFTIFGAIFSSLSAMYFLLPIFSAIIGGLIAFCLIMFMIFSVVVTLGMVLVVDGYRNWIGNNMMDVPNFFFNLSENMAKLAPYYLVVGIPAIVLCGTGFTLSIIGQSKHYKFFISYIVVNAVFLTIAMIFTTLFFIFKMNILEL